LLVDTTPCPGIGGYDERARAMNKATAESAQQRFDRIMREYGPALSRLTAGYEKVASVREELMQEIALAIWQALPQFRGECSERTFVYRIGHNRGLTHTYRRPAAHQRLDELPHLELVDPQPRPDQQVATIDQHDRLRSAIQTLPLTYRQVVMLWLEDLAQADIAAVLGITEGNVAVRLNRARAALKQALQERTR
jgi:RNA polymerase sigma factor (sigma-70 family)